MPQANQKIAVTSAPRGTYLGSLQRHTTALSLLIGVTALLIFLMPSEAGEKGFWSSKWIWQTIDMNKASTALYAKTFAFGILGLCLIAFSLLLRGILRGLLIFCLGAAFVYLGFEDISGQNVQTLTGTYAGKIFLCGFLGSFFMLCGGRLLAYNRLATLYILLCTVGGALFLFSWFAPKDSANPGEKTSFENSAAVKAWKSAQEGKMLTQDQIGFMNLRYHEIGIKRWSGKECWILFGTMLIGIISILNIINIGNINNLAGVFVWSISIGLAFLIIGREIFVIYEKVNFRENRLEFYNQIRAYLQSGILPFLSFWVSQIGFTELLGSIVHAIRGDEKVVTI